MEREDRCDPRAAADGAGGGDEDRVEQHAVHGVPRDVLQELRAYWRTHRYQSTTLTVDEPLVDQSVFPTALKGVMIHGDKYWEDGGISYQFYTGISQEEEFQLDSRTLQFESTAGCRRQVHPSHTNPALLQ